jgi:hypothetical protein
MNDLSDELEKAFSEVSANLPMTMRDQANTSRSALGLIKAELKRALLHALPQPDPKSCPFCESTDIGLLIAGVVVAACCADCCARGPVAVFGTRDPSDGDLHNARELWNRRYAEGLMLGGADADKLRLDLSNVCSAEEAKRRVAWAREQRAEMMRPKADESNQ